MDEVNRSIEMVVLRLEVLDRRLDALDRRFDAVERRFDDLVVLIEERFVELKAQRRRA